MAAGIDHFRAVMRIEEDCDDLHVEDLAELAGEYKDHQADVGASLAKGRPSERLFVGGGAYQIGPVFKSRPPFAAVELWARHEESVVRVSKELDVDDDRIGPLIDSPWNKIPGMGLLRARQAAKLARTILALPDMNIAEFEWTDEQAIDDLVLHAMRQTEADQIYPPEHRVTTGQVLRQLVRTGYDSTRGMMKPDVYVAIDDDIPIWQAHRNGFELTAAISGMHRAIKMIKHGDLIAPPPLHRRTRTSVARQD